MSGMDMAGAEPVAVAGLPVDRQSCLADSRGRIKRSLERRAAKILDRVAPVLRPVLEEGEVIRHVTPATSPYSLLELLTTGWVLHAVKRCVLVVTDRRILHVPVRPSLEPRLSVSQVRFADLEEVRVGGWIIPSVKVRYRRGGTERFGGLPLIARRRLRRLLEGTEGLGEPTARGRRHYLCLRCGHTLPDGMERCGGCGLRFKDRHRARWLSILVPGGGYFYTGHPLLGLMDAVVEGFLILVLVLFVREAASAGAGVRAIAPFLFLGGVLAVEKLVTIYHAQHYVREFLPAEKSFRPGPVSLAAD